MKKEKQICDFGIKDFNKNKRSKDFVKAIRDREKKVKEHKYHCPDGYEWDLDTEQCVPIVGEAAAGATTAPGTDKQKPSTPQNLRVTGVGSTFISLEWSPSTDNVAVLSYKIFFKEGNGTTYAVTTRGTVANFQDFKPDTTYSFYVKAVDTSNNLSNASTKVSAKTLSIAPPPPPPPLPKGAVIYIDFNGGVVSGTMWNVNGDIPYEPSGLTISEEDVIVAGIVQDYAPFNVIITADKAIYDAADSAKRTHVIVTESWEWYGQAGGVAYIGSMFWGDGSPAWVFSSLLGYSSKYVAEACSHEAGHTVGLRHQSSYDVNCVKTAEYNPGNSTCACAPIMGVSYYQPDGKWWVGPNSLSCTTIQDDFQFIASKLGLK